MLEYFKREEVMNRRINREKGVITVYEDLILNRDADELISDNFNDDSDALISEVFRDREIPENDEEDDNEDTYILSAVRQALDNRERYAGYIGRVLEGWTYERLGEMEKAILLMGCAEFDLKQIQAAVIIDEYVSLAKKYCDADSYKLINGVLDRI